MGLALNLTLPGLRLLRLLRPAPGDRPPRPPQPPRPPLPPAPSSLLVTDAGETLVAETGTPLATGPS